MKQTPKEKAKKLFDYHHKLITNVGGELAQEILVSILAEQCALFFARKMLKEKWDAKKYNEYEYWNEVNVEIVNYSNFKL